jgi:ABC-type uncharacterized transport system substrate-binding protein
VSLRPDVIFANGVTSVTALQRETTSIPIVFVQLADPVCIRFGPSLNSISIGIFTTPHFHVGV